MKNSLFSKIQHIKCIAFYGVLFSLSDIYMNKKQNENFGNKYVITMKQ